MAGGLLGLFSGFGTVSLKVPSKVSIPPLKSASAARGMLRLPKTMSAARPSTETLCGFNLPLTRTQTP